MRTRVCLAALLGALWSAPAWAATVAGQPPAVAAATSAQSLPPSAPPTQAAEAPVPVASDGPRLRYSLGVEGGQLLAPSAFNFTNVAVDGELGVQVNNALGVYLTPNAGAMFGHAGGVTLGVGLLVDDTHLVGDAITVGGGLETKLALAVGHTTGGGAFYGAVLRFGWNALVNRGDDGIRRTALTVGIDLHLLAGPPVNTTASNIGDTTGKGLRDFAVEPMLTVRYVAF